jgi:hypothetical protein
MDRWVWWPAPSVALTATRDLYVGCVMRFLHAAASASGLLPASANRASTQQCAEILDECLVGNRAHELTLYTQRGGRQTAAPFCLAEQRSAPIRYYQSPVGQPLVALTGVHVRTTAPDEVFSIEKTAPLGSAVASTLYEFAVTPETPEA